MNILFVFRDDNTSGGAATILRQVIEYYISQGSFVHIVFLKEKTHGHFDDIVCDNLKLYFGGSLAKTIHNFSVVHRINFDYSYNSVVKFTGLVGVLKRLGILHINTMVGRESTSIFLRFNGLKLLYYMLWYRLGYKAANIIICQSDVMKNQFTENLPWIEKYAKVVVIPNPVNVVRMNEMSKEEIVVTLFHPYIITAGRMINEKAYDILLDAYAIVHKSFPKLKLVILGDGILRPQIEQQIANLGVEDSVHLAGQVPNVYPWFKKATLCVVSSRMEGFPNVLLQMMSQNDRVVSTLCAGGIEKIEGLYTCPINDSVALAKSMLDCLENDITGKRLLFDQELNNRSIDNFIRIVEKSK